MSSRFRKHKRLITELESKAEQRDFHGIINLLIANFERGRTPYTQSAYIIGRHFMRLEDYVQAREWLRKAEYRNLKTNLYGNRIARWIRQCDIHLLDEADDLAPTIRVVGRDGNVHHSVVDPDFDTRFRELGLERQGGLDRLLRGHPGHGGDVRSRAVPVEEGSPHAGQVRKNTSQAEGCRRVGARRTSPPVQLTEVLAEIQALC